MSLTLFFIAEVLQRGRGAPVLVVLVAELEAEVLVVEQVRDVSAGSVEGYELDLLEVHDVLLVVVVVGPVGVVGGEGVLLLVAEPGAGKQGPLASEHAGTLGAAEHALADE